MYLSSRYLYKLTFLNIGKCSVKPLGPDALTFRATSATLGYTEKITEFCFLSRLLRGLLTFDVNSKR